MPPQNEEHNSLVIRRVQGRNRVFSISLYNSQGDLFGIEQGGDVAEADAGEFECGDYL